MGLHKIVKILAWIFGLAGIATYIMILVKGDKAIDAERLAGDVSAVSPIYAVAWIIFVLLLAFLIFFVLKGIAAGNVKKTLLSLGIFVVIAIIGYAMASGSTEGLPDNAGEPLTETTSKWVGAGLNTFYILAVLAVASMVFSGFNKVKNR